MYNTPKRFKRTTLLIGILLLISIAYPFIMSYLLSNYTVIGSDFSNETWFILTYTYYPALMSVVVTFFAVLLAFHQNNEIVKNNMLTTALNFIPTIIVTRRNHQPIYIKEPAFDAYNAITTKIDLIKWEGNNFFQSLGKSDFKSRHPEIVAIFSDEIFPPHELLNLNEYYKEAPNLDLNELYGLVYKRNKIKAALTKKSIDINSRKVEITLSTDDVLNQPVTILTSLINLSNDSDFNISEIHIRSITIDFEGFTSKFNLNTDLNINLTKFHSNAHDYNSIEIILKILIRPTDSNKIESYNLNIELEIEYDFGLRYNCQLYLPSKNMAEKLVVPASCYPLI